MCGTYETLKILELQKKNDLSWSRCLEEKFNIAVFVRSNSACSEHLFVVVAVAYYAACLLRLWWGVADYEVSVCRCMVLR